MAEAGDDGGTPLNTVRAAAHSGIRRVRDERRKGRKRLEGIFGRKTFTSFAVVGAMGKMVETSIVPFIDPTASVPLGRLLAWFIVWVVALAIAVQWERVAKAAEEVADVAEEKTEPEDG